MGRRRGRRRRRRDDLTVRPPSGGPTPYPAHTETATDVTGGGLEVAVRDVVGDDSPDVVITSFNAGFAYLKGDGTGALEPGVTASNGATNQGLAIADFDGDGATDVVTWDRSGLNPQYLYYRSLKRDGTWPPPSFLNAFPAPAALNGGGFYEDYPVAADMDNDGHPDVVMADGSVTVPVSGAANAKGRVLIRTVKAFRIKNGARSRTDRRHRFAKVTLAKRAFVVSPTGKISLKVKLVNQYRQALQGVEQVKATVTVTVDGHAVTRRVTLVLPRG
jgi:hypothetical protein